MQVVASLRQFFLWSGIVEALVRQRVILLLVGRTYASPSSQEFDWIAQLRYYWRQKGSITLKDSMHTGRARYFLVLGGWPTTLSVCSVQRL